MATGNPADKIEVASTDVIRLIAQFCKEANLTRTLATLEDESQVRLNTVASHEQFRDDILAGRWDAVLGTTRGLDLPERKVQDLYELIILELVEMRDRAAAKILLRQTGPMMALRDNDPDRYLHLEHLLTLVEYHPKMVYGGEPKEKRRERVAKALLASLGVPIPTGRLLALISDALKHQSARDPALAAAAKHAGQWDLFRMAPPTIFAHSDVDSPVTAAYATLALASGQSVESVAFSPSGDTIATGDAEGFIELWDSATGKLRMDLTYQARDKIMSMAGAVLALAWSRDGSMLATGSQDGSIKVWQVSSGKCINRVPRAHAQGVACILFNSDTNTIISGGFDAMVRIHGLTSGSMIKEFRGHSSFVNAVVFNSDGSRLFSGSSDGMVKIWDTRTGGCLKTLAPTAPDNRAVTHLQWVAARSHLQIGTATSTLTRVDAKGTVATQISLVDAIGTVNAPVASCISPQGELAYVVNEIGALAIVNIKGRSARKVELGIEKVIGVTSCPNANAIAVWTETGIVSLWKA
ncbi:hypothetical protein BC828DRAFT_379153 [Blastocladiella britannica]|nr:hypothetical protein BC828DRAFT_379153 [Blastocladiella britannica]